MQSIEYIFCVYKCIKNTVFFLIQGSNKNILLWFLNQQSLILIRLNNIIAIIKITSKMLNK